MAKLEGLVLARYPCCLVLWAEKAAKDSSVKAKAAMELEADYKRGAQRSCAVAEEVKVKN